ncbi:hypothetical protein Tco_0926075 [Tanacetum coccineum]|uniref:Uncharacterized protein n=1 Tax=Tanacetum coccineum TaxID=301880 RepID=A0ABQ5DBP1_9ASTR
MMTARKRVGLLPTHRLAVRHFADHSFSDSSSEASSDFHSGASSNSSLRHSLSDHSSPDLPSTSAGPSRKRRRDSGYSTDVEVDPRETSLRDDCFKMIGISSRVDGRTYLQSGAIDGSEANGIIRDPKLELESSRFTFDLVPLSYESVDSKEEYESHVKMIVESLKEEKMYVKFSNNVEVEHRESYLDVEGIKWVMSRSWHCRKEQTIL